MSFLGDVGLAGLNAGLSILGNKISSDSARDNLDYQMDRYYSPQAQVRNLAAAGINPAVAFGNQSPVFSGGGQFQMPANPLQGIGTTSLSDLANYMNAKANAKKTGAETRNLDIDAQAKQFELQLNKFFSAPERIAAITLAWKNVMLKNDEHNINEWKQESEKALSQLKGIERDSAQKLLDNMDIQIEQENKQRSENIKLTQEKQKTEGTLQTANKAAATASYASAESSKAQAALHRSNTKYQDIVNDIKDSGKVFELENILQRWKSENKINQYQFENGKFWLRRMSKLNKQLTGSDLKSKIEQEMDDFFWYWKDEVPNIDMPTFMIPLK